MIGQTVSHYRIVSVLGGGGMSVVYKAQDMRLGRFVALKFLLEQFCKDRESLEQFQQEARTASALNHPAFCTVHDIDRHRERPFIVMEYLEGETLRDKLRRQGLTMHEAVTCAIQIADAVRLAHAAGIVHGDISPANLFVTTCGRVKLLDFGLAKSVAQIQRHGASDTNPRRRRTTITGTIHYMSPEQTLGEDVDARSDIFSLGVVIYEMLAGRRPFVGQNASTVVTRIIRGTPAPLRSIVPNAPPEIEEVVHRCLDKDPEQRFRTAVELRAALRLAAANSVLDRKIRVKAGARCDGETMTDSTRETKTIGVV